MHNISVKKIGVFISAADAGSFTAGARKSNISQPAAVSIIDEIETTIGEELFFRSGKARRATLTPRGKEVYDTLVRAKAFYDEAIESICRPKKRKNAQTVLIQMPYASAVSLQWLRNVMSIIVGGPLSIRTAEWNQIMITLERRETCMTRETFMAIVDGEFRPKDCEYLQLGISEMVLITSKFKLRESGDELVSWEAVPRGTFIYTGVNPAINEMVYENLKKIAGADKDQFVEVNCPYILRGLTEQYEIAAIVPRLMVKFLRTDVNRLRCLQFSQPRVHIKLGLLVPFDYSIRFKINRSELQKVFDQEILQ